MPRKRKKKKKDNVTYCIEEKKKKKNKGNLRRSPCAHAYEHFCQSTKNLSPLSFLSILVGLRRKYLDSTIYYPFFLSNQTHSKKVFLAIFSPKFSIHFVSPRNKYTIYAWGGVNSVIRLLTYSIYLLPNVFPP